jgi:uncharacterized protein (TIGR00369 family)
VTALDRFRKMVAGELPPPPFLRMLGIRMVEVEAGHVVFDVTPGEQHYNGMGVAHGGLAATLMDSALGVAINSMAPEGKRFATLELKVNYTRPITTETGAIRCEGRAIHVGNRTATAEARIVDTAGKLYAHGTTTCITVDR